MEIVTVEYADGTCGGAIYLASKGRSGWVWFLFAAVILGTTTVAV